MPRPRPDPSASRASASQLNAIRELRGMPGGETLRRTPEGHDVVVALAARGDLDELDRAGTPITLRLDPGARPPLVRVLEILKIARIARALHQPKPLRRLGGERRDLQFDGVGELAEDVLAGARGDLQTVGVMHLGAVVVEAAAVGLIEQKHGGERRDPDHAQIGSREQRALHVHHRFDARRHGETVSARGGFAFEQRIDHDRGCVRRGLFDPEMGEGGEFLAGRLRGIDGESARRKAVQQILRDAPKIARALKYQELVPGLFRVDLSDSRNPDSGSETLPSCGRDGAISNIAGVATRSCAVSPSTVETVTGGACWLNLVRKSSSRKGKFSLRQIAASRLKWMLRYCSGLSLSRPAGRVLRCGA